jgi:lipopolysaccharide export system permease protein
MPRLFRYIFNETAWPFLFFLCALAAIVWLSQSLRYVSVIVDQGQSAGTFLYLIVLMLPSLMIFTLPVALLFATFYSLYRLQTDSELIVMAASGRSRYSIAWPLVALAAIACVAHFAVNLYLMPLGQRTLKDRMFEIRGDLVSNILREGQFTTPSDGLTVYVRERDSAGAAKGILVHDNRDAARPVTYLAESGRIIPSDAGPRFVLMNGNVQRVEGPGRIQSLSFDRYVIDLAPFQKEERDMARGVQERYLDELFNPPDGPALTQQRRQILAAEGHERLSSPLYAFTFVLIAAAAVASTGSARRSVALRITLAAFVCLAFRLAGMGAEGIVARNPELWFVLYLVPLLGMATGLAWLSGTPLWQRRPRPAPQEAMA